MEQQAICLSKKWIVTSEHANVHDSDCGSLSSGLLSITCLLEGSHANMNDNGSCEGELRLVYDLMPLGLPDSGKDTQK